MKTLHLICNAHLDPVWLWDWEEGAAAALSTFRSAVKLAQEFDYIFCHNEALLFQWIEEYDPPLFAKLQKLSDAGKLKIMGGWYLQPDANLPTGESLIRQIMVGRRYFDEKFGQHPTTAVNVDSFGHSLGLPQILRGCGYDSYLIGRPFPKQNVFPNDFVWEGMDGSKVRVCRIANGYNTLMGEAAKKIHEALLNQNEQDIGIVLWGVGNHGGGPSRKDLSDIAALMQTSSLRILHSTPEQYMAEPTQELPIYKKSLNPCMPGCYTSMVRVKQLHRKLEAELYKAEKISSAAALQTGMHYPSEELETAEKDLLFSEFHDILPGSAIRSGEDTGIQKLNHGLEIVRRVSARALFALSDNERPAEEGNYPIIVYNPHPYRVKTVIEADFILQNQNWDDTFTNVTVYDGNAPLPSQVVQEASMVNLDWAKRVLFQCELKPMSINRFDARTTVTACRPIMPALEQDFKFENSTMSAVIDARTGMLKSYTVEGKELINRVVDLALYEDNADPWAMSDVQLLHLPGKRIGSFRLMTESEAQAYCGAAEPTPPIRIIENGDVATEIEALLCCRASTAKVNWRFYRDASDVDVTIQLLFLEKDALVKWCLPTGFTGTVYGQQAYSQEELPVNGQECASQDWITISDSEKTFAILKQGCYGLDCSPNELRVTLVRGACYAAHPIDDRPLLRADRSFSRMDQGERTFKFRLTGGNVAQVKKELERKAQSFIESPYVLQMFPSGHGQNPHQSLIELDDSCVVMTACKSSRDGGYILRFHNNTESPTDCMCRIPDLHIDSHLHFNPYQVRTFRLDAHGLDSCDTFDI